MALTNICAICGESFSSLLIPRTAAAREIGIQMQQHLQEKHKQELEAFILNDLGKITTLASGIAMINRFVQFSDDDRISQQEHVEKCDTLMDLMGFDEMGEEDEELEEMPEETENPAIPLEDILGKNKDKKKSNLIILPS